jgi:hypothetical protein
MAKNEFNFFYKTLLGEDLNICKCLPARPVTNELFVLLVYSIYLFFCAFIRNAGCQLFRLREISSTDICTSHNGCRPETMKSTLHDKIQVCFFNPYFRQSHSTESFFH